MTDTDAPMETGEVADRERRSAPRLPLLGLEDLDTDQRALYDAIANGPRQLEHGPPLSGPFNSMLHHPPIGDALQRLGATIRYEGRLPDRERELATLVVSAWFESEFEWFAHGAAARELGIDDAQLDAIKAGHAPPGASEAEALVVGVVRALLRHGDLTDDEYLAAVRALGRDGVVELTSLVGYYSLLALQLRVFRVGLPDGVPGAF